MAKVIREEKRDLVPRILLRMCILLLSILLWYPLPLTVIGEPREYIKKKNEVNLDLVTCRKDSNGCPRADQILFREYIFAERSRFSSFRETGEFF